MLCRGCRTRSYKTCEGDLIPPWGQPVAVGAPPVAEFDDIVVDFDEVFLADA